MKLFDFSLNDVASIANIINLFVAIFALLIAYLAWRHPKNIEKDTSTVLSQPRNTKKKLLLSISAAAVIFLIFHIYTNPPTPQIHPAPAPTPYIIQKLTPMPTVNPEQNPGAAQLSPSPDPTSTNNNGYIRTQCKSIRDIRNGNEWFIGPDSNLTMVQAKEWVSSLTECGGNWKMPTEQQIQTLHSPTKNAGTGTFINGKYWPAKIDPAFDAIGKGSWVWIIDEKNPGRPTSFNLHEWTTVTRHPERSDYTTRAFAVRRIQ